MIKTVLFDLDGTLLPMDQDEFIKAYFGSIAKKLAPHGYDPQELIGAIWSGTKAMVKNNGSMTNEQAFWADFSAHYGENARADEPLFDEFYASEFGKIQAVCGFDSRAAQIVHQIKARGLQVVLATNPIFPAVATRQRIAWAGLQPEDFELFTTYENSNFCKPNLDYYRQILNRLELDPAQCLMVGNDVGEDMIAEKLGMKVFLLTDCLINKDNTDISRYPHGSFPELKVYLENL